MTSILLSDEPVIEWVDKLITNAICAHVSDIHIEPFENICRIRFRSDGLLSEVATCAINFALRVITRLKVMANLNIAEHRLPQDGYLLLHQHKNQVDIRISICPTLFGEKIVLRIFDTKNLHLDIHSLGMTEEQQTIFLEKLNQPQGLIIVTGPTGCGKTVTLYSALNYLNQIEKNISTVEDPVEIKLSGINQVNIHAKIGLEFATILRTMLRQDPDIIMIGEIRDTETAAVAIQAAQTGHLVLTTLHTNSTTETMTRLQSLGVSSYSISHSISLIIAQRLVRKLCDCKKTVVSTCHQCHQGYKGRIAVFELDEINHSNDLSLWQAGLLKVQQGVTSLAELSRVLGKK